MDNINEAVKSFVEERIDRIVRIGKGWYEFESKDEAEHWIRRFRFASDVVLSFAETRCLADDKLIKELRTRINNVEYKALRGEYK